MKKFLVIFSLMLTFAMSAQDTNVYAIFGVSMSGGNFAQNSYPSIEVGVTRTNVAVAVVFGRGALDGTFSDQDHITDYFYEAKIAPYYTIGRFTGNVFLGAGGYFGTNHYFTDLGLGLCYNVGDFGYGVAFNRWDEVNYLSPSITYNFN